MEHNHKYFTDKKINHEMRMGTGRFIDSIFMIKCRGCYAEKEASEENFHKLSGGLRARCKPCVYLAVKI
ncbi:MAG TPA: hypothetical protein EYN67_11280 [Flavobacteriales bacterium]|nr:hypothetical protein [Flavobacteriales bacterium]